MVRKKLLLLSTLLAYFGAMCSAFAVVPQIIRVIKLQDAMAISYLFIALRMVAFISFMAAVAITGHYLVASSYVLILMSNLYLLLLKFYYARKKLRLAS